MDMQIAASQLFPGSVIAKSLMPPSNKPRIRPTNEKTGHGKDIFLAPDGEPFFFNNGEPHFVRKQARKAFETKKQTAAKKSLDIAQKNASRRERERLSYIAWLDAGLPKSAEDAFRQRPEWMSDSVAKELVEANYKASATMVKAATTSTLAPGAFNPNCPRIDTESHKTNNRAKGRRGGSGKSKGK
jgi:hypothetical protein